MELRVGEKTTIRLPGLGLSGYRWTAEVSGDAVTVSLRPAPRPPHPPGAGGEEILQIEARLPGRSTVIVEQRRSWENAPQPHDRRVVEVTVT